MMRSADAFTAWLAKVGCFIVAFVTLVLLVACGSSGQKVLYVVGLGSPQVVMFKVSGSGALTAPTVTGTGSAPAAMAIDPKKRFAFIADSAPGSAAGGISQYLVTASSGKLAASMVQPNTSTPSTVPVPPVPAGANPVALAIDGKGLFLFVANKDSNSISVFAIDQTAGNLIQITGSPFATAAGPSSLAIFGNFLFVANAGASQVSVYTFDSKTGALTAAAGSPFAAGVSPVSVSVDPNGRFLYVSDQAANSVLGFSVGSGGALTAMSGSPFAAGTAPASVHVHRSGKFVFVANSGSNDVSAFSVGSSGALTAVSGSPFKAGTGPSFVLTDSGGGLLFVTDAGSNDISVFGINGSNGGLTAVGGSPFALEIGTPVGLATLN